ncbi:hypothetical protein [Inhella proteolytica]|uniref:Uncharacterized protein n=1 Tax=Inhella proteolytica TaxID=2795029 RepID=A0A931NHE7_9BURK|nr:hypothetical protein [Inhella proteolytica]MBH9578146.1 hypothetical protein [Inhella proteolytica]
MNSAKTPQCLLAAPQQASCAGLRAGSPTGTQRGWTRSNAGTAAAAGLRSRAAATRCAAALGSLLLLGACAATPDAEQLAFQQKYAKAKALFEERCKTAGVVIHRTVKDVEGIELTKIRQPVPWGGKEYFDPMYPGAAMAGEVSGDRYVWQFLASEFRLVNAPERRGGFAHPKKSLSYLELPPTRGYQFVEYQDAISQGRMRCRASLDPDPRSFDRFMLCERSHQSAPRYALDFEDLADASDREFWVAGTKLKVIDKHTGEVIAQLTRFVWDPGFGASTTGRWPWQHANARASTVCPSDANQFLHHDSRYFVDQVLIPKQGD